MIATAMLRSHFIEVPPLRTTAALIDVCVSFRTMNSSSNNEVSSVLKAVPFQLNMWLGSFIWLAGNIGCLGNMIVFRSRSFRRRAYSIYLLAESMSDFIYFNFVLSTRVLQKGFQIPITTRYEAVCKLRQFTSVWGNQVSFTLFAFATIDRLLSAQRDNSE